jgi:hypothetical protein
LLATEKVTDDMARVLASGFGALVEEYRKYGSSAESVGYWRFG